MNPIFSIAVVAILVIYYFVIDQAALQVTDNNSKFLIAFGMAFLVAFLLYFQSYIAPLKKLSEKNSLSANIFGLGVMFIVPLIWIVASKKDEDETEEERKRKEGFVSTLALGTIMFVLLFTFITYIWHERKNRNKIEKHRKRMEREMLLPR